MNNLLAVIEGLEDTAYEDYYDETINDLDSIYEYALNGCNVTISNKEASYIQKICQTNGELKHG